VLGVFAGMGGVHRWGGAGRVGAPRVDTRLSLRPPHGARSTAPGGLGKDGGGGPPAAPPRPGHRESAVTVLIALFGGMALVLYGIRLSGEAFQRALGSRLRNLLPGLSRRRLMAVLSGAAITALIQSSAATTLMLIGFVSAGLMTFRQTLGLILGADIGTTFTVQLIAFRVTDYSPLLVGLGFTTMFVARRRVPKDLGQALLGLGLMFLGLKLILDNVEPIRSTPLAVDL